MAIINIETHTPNNDDRYFLDCNVLMYVFYLNGSYASDLIYSYSELITKIINADGRIYITDMLISEFVNTYIQTEFHRLATLNHWPHTKEYFKRSFKNTTEYADILIEIKYILQRQLFPIASRMDARFSEMPLDNIFDNPQTFDFNDRYYGLTLENKETYIVTNDADFSNIEQCDVITKNRRLLGIN